MLLDIFCKPVVGVLFLHLQHLGHGAVGGAEFQFPVHKPPVYVCPVLPVLTVQDLHGNLLEIRLVLTLCYLRLNLTAVDVLLQCQQYLIGVYGLDEIVGNLLSDGLFHQVLLLALGDHDYR